MMSLDRPKNPIVLVVDDTPEILSLIHSLLSSTYQVKSANSGKRGLQIAQSDTAPDLILLDIMMPGMDGMTACYHIKGQDTTGKTRVVMLTGINHELNKKVSFSVMRADGYITKPFEKEGLFKTIEDVLAKAPVSDCTPAST